LFVAFATTYKGSELHAARQVLQHAIELDPGYARAHAVLSNVEAVFWSHQVDSSYLDPVVLDRAAQLSQKAVQLDPYLPQAYGSRILPLTWMHQHDAALVAIERALLLNPNFIDTRFVPGYLYAGAFDRCIECARTTMRFDPFYRPITTVWLGWAHYMVGNYRDALAPLRESQLRAPNTRHPHTPLAATYAQLGRMEEARQAAAHVLRLDPGWTLQESLSVNAYRNRHDVEHLIDGCRKAGLPV
jgi:adenylate cyclase